jgi:Uma2 family endonuclease
MSWQDFEALLAIRGERSGVRMYYLDGEVEIMSPTKIHEGRKTTLARLLEIWAMESDIALNGFGSWTLTKELREAGPSPTSATSSGSRRRKPFRTSRSRSSGRARPVFRNPRCTAGSAFASCGR